MSRDRKNTIEDFKNDPRTGANMLGSKTKKDSGAVPSNPSDEEKETKMAITAKVERDKPASSVRVTKIGNGWMLKSGETWYAGTEKEVTSMLLSWFHDFSKQIKFKGAQEENKNKPLIAKKDGGWEER